jgi:diketogulonate reductase-like aldo/keto reductase
LIHLGWLDLQNRTLPHQFHQIALSLALRRADCLHVNVGRDFQARIAGVLAWSPLAKGVLSGKYHGEGKADGGRMSNEEMKEFLPEEQRATPIISALKSVAKQTGRSMAQVALAWLRHQTAPIIPIIGARKVSQLQDNLASLDLELSAEQLKSLNGASRIELGFPQSIYEREMVRASGMAACGIASGSRARFLYWSMTISNYKIRFTGCEESATVHRHLSLFLV